VPEQSPSYFTKEHFEKFIARLEEEWFKEIVVFAVLTGLRRSEIVNLKWSKVDLQRGILMVESEGNFKTKQGRRRVVPLNQSAKDLLNAMHERNAEGYVFRFEGAKIEPGLLSHKFKDCLRRTNLDKKELHFHSLRHTFASWLVQNSVSIYAVKELLGHTDVKTTQIYSHLSGSSLQNEVNLINISAKA
jgi:integrase